jgi:hypothetical protein
MARPDARNGPWIRVGYLISNPRAHSPARSSLAEARPESRPFAAADAAWRSGALTPSFEPRLIIQLSGECEFSLIREQQPAYQGSECGPHAPASSMSYLA